MKQRTPPRFPDGVALDTVIACRMKVFIDTSGRPERIECEDCPPPFDAASSATLMKWLWHPAMIDGKPVPTQFLTVMKYLPNVDPEP